MVLTRATRLERVLSALLLALPLLAVGGQAVWRRADRALDVTLCCERSREERVNLAFDPWNRVAIEPRGLYYQDAAPWLVHERLEELLTLLALSLERALEHSDAALAARLHAAARGHAWNGDLLRRAGKVELGYLLSHQLSYSMGPDQRDDLGGGDDVVLLQRSPPDLRLVAWDWLPWLGCAGAALLGAGLLVARVPLLPARTRAELEALLALPLAGVALLVGLGLAWLIEGLRPGSTPPTHPLRELLPAGLPLAPELSLALAALGLLGVEVALLRLERRWRAGAGAALTT